MNSEDIKVVAYYVVKTLKKTDITLEGINEIYQEMVDTTPDLLGKITFLDFYELVKMKHQREL